MSKKKPAVQQRPGFKKTKRAALIAAGLLLLGCLSFPIWSVWLAKPLAAMAGVEIASVDSLSWDRWQIKGLSFQSPGVALEAKTIELPSPTELALQYFSSSPANQSIVVKNWTLETDSSATPKQEASPAPTLDETITLVKDGLAQLSRFLKDVQLSNGLITADGTKTFAIPELRLSPGSLQGDVNYLPNEVAATFELAFSDTWTLTSQVPKFALSTKLVIQPQPGNLTLDGSISTSGNPIAVTSSWASDTANYIPRTAALSTSAFALDGRYPIWQEVPALFLNSNIAWADEQITYSIRGFDTAESTNIPQVQISGSGSLLEIVIETAQVDLPWLEVRNDQAIRINPRLDNPLTDAQVTAKLKLDEFPFTNAKGDLVARLRTKSSAEKIPIIVATLQGSGISFFDTTIETLSGTMELNGKTLALDSLSLTTSNGSQLAGQGGYDLETQSISPSQLSVSLENESEMLRNLLPDVGWQTLNASVDLQGPVKQVSFQAQIESEDLTLPGIKPFSLAADAKGQGSHLQASLTADNGSETFLATLETSNETADKLISLSKLEFKTKTGTPLLALDSPQTIRILSSNGSITIPELSFSGDHDLRLFLSDFQLAPEALNLKSEIANLDPRIFQNWLISPIPAITLQSLTSNLSLDQDGSQTNISGQASYFLSEKNPVELSWQASTNHQNQNALAIEQLLVSSNNKDIFAASGTIPISLSWIQGSLKTEMLPDSPLDFQLHSNPHPDFWKALVGIVPVSIKRPRVDAELSGSINRPQGHFDLKLDSLRWSDPQDPSKTLELEELQATLLATTSGISIETLDGRIGKNHIKASASLPLKGRSLPALFENPDTLSTDSITAQAEISITELEALKNWLPPMLRYNGQAQIKLMVNAGDITASGTLKDLATRPLPPLGGLSKISGSFDFKDGIWKTTGITGIADKSPFTLVGQADLNSLDKPLFDLNFTSKEFPLVRDDGLILSGDIDMNLVSSDQGQTQLQGELILKKGLALLEPDLLASSTKTVSTRPPYFAVDQEPFSDWGLDIDIRGNQFLRVSNSYFQGTLSAEFDLEGSLGAPLLIGKAETYAGRIFFPASSLKLKTGQGFITRDQPSVLQIEALAEGRLFAYDINLEVTGTADNPEMIITSNPAMTQVEALLLLTTGALPNDGGNLAQQSATSLGVFIGKGLFKKLTGGNSDSASKLNLEVGQDISLQGKKTIDATYQLSEDLELEGEYDKRDEFNANIKWTIFKR